MAKDVLTTYAPAGAVLSFGVVIELAAGQTVLVSLADWTVGAVLVLLAFASPGRRLDRVALLAGVLWLLASVPETSLGWWDGLGGALALAYRGPLMHLVIGPTLTGWVKRMALTVCYGTALIVATWAGIATGVVAAVLAAGLVLAPRTRATAAVLAVLGIAWIALALELLGGRTAVLLSDVVVLLAAWFVWSRRRSQWSGRAVAGMVVELVQDDRPAAPLHAALAKALADPGLQVVIYVSGEGWRDDSGTPVAEPELEGPPHGFTVTPMPGGGRLVLLHSRSSGADRDLSAAAGRAAVLALERVRITTQIRLRSDEVRDSGARLLAVDVEERRALAARLAAGPRRRLNRVGELLDTTGEGPQLADIAERLAWVDAELDRLGHGLLPYALQRGRLSDALRSTTADMGLPVTLELVGAIDAMPEGLRAIVYFVTTEALANVARHARASHATVSVTLRQVLRVEIRDDGIGGATTIDGHGLQGLSDRVTMARGSLSVESPAGGPTIVLVEIPPGDAGSH